MRRTPYRSSFGQSLLFYHWVHAWYQKSPHDETLSKSISFPSGNSWASWQCLFCLFYMMGWCYELIYHSTRLFCSDPLYLQLSGKLSHHINLHYSYSVYISMVLSFCWLWSNFYIWIKKINSQPFGKSSGQNQLFTVTTSLDWAALPTVFGTREPYSPWLSFPTAEGIRSFRQAKEHPVNTSNPDTSTYFSKSVYERNEGYRR